MLVECPNCEAVVQTECLKSHDIFHHEDPIRVSLVVCPKCHDPMLVAEEMVWVSENVTIWANERRLWPSPRWLFSSTIPLAVRNSLDEAQRCYSAHAYTACAAMCGRALEALCRLLGTKEYLAAGLEELKEKGIIDLRLYEWGEQLRDRRNVAAHATGERISKAEAEDLIDFTVAICEYVFVLKARFEEFQKRIAMVKRSD